MAHASIHPFDKPFALPYPRFKIEDGDIKAEGLISISGSTPEPFKEKALPLENFPDVLFLHFDDIPFRSMRKEGKLLAGPSKKDVMSAMRFAKKLREKHPQPSALLAVNCMAGKSRSAAIALAINALLAKEKYGAENEGDVVKSLLAYDPNQQMCFNPMIVRFADEILQNHGALNKALDALCPPYRSWKKYWDRYRGED